jgi:hypothetical protein
VLGENRNKQLIQAIYNEVHKEILSDLKVAKYYYIIVGCTQDLRKSSKCQ